MARPSWKICRRGTYIGRFFDVNDAVVAVAALGPRHTIKGPRSGRAVWQEGLEDQRAIDSYDHAAEVCLVRDEALAELAPKKRRHQS